MKNILLLAFLIVSSISNGQSTIYDTITHDGLQRAFILYVPASYSTGTPAPLVMNFHGYTSNSNEQMYYGDFRPISDTAGFLLVHPMGTLDGSSQPYWNANWGGTVNDIGFTDALIDSLAADYNVNLDRVYSTGMSNGGFMSYTLACELSGRIAAIASVTGSMNLNQSLTCNPQHPMPVMEIHGTSDATVPYSGGGTIASIPSALNYWTTFNQCGAPIETAVPNIVPGDGCTATHFIYSNGNNGVDVEHFRINNGGHTWPGAPIAIGTTNYDIDASKEIWRFFSQFDINGKIVLGTQNISSTHQEITISPIPSSDIIHINGLGALINPSNIQIVDAFGKQVLEISEYENGIHISSLNTGIYFFRVDHKYGVEIVRFLKM